MRSEIVGAASGRLAGGLRAEPYYARRHREHIPKVAVERRQIPHHLGRQGRLDAILIGIERRRLGNDADGLLGTRQREPDIDALRLVGFEGYSLFRHAEASGLHTDCVAPGSQAAEAVIAGGAGGSGHLNSGVHISQRDRGAGDRRTGWIGYDTLNIAAEYRLGLAAAGEPEKNTCHTRPQSAHEASSPQAGATWRTPAHRHNVFI